MCLKKGGFSVTKRRIEQVDIVKFIAVASGICVSGDILGCVCTCAVGNSYYTVLYYKQVAAVFGRTKKINGENGCLKI